MSGEKIEGGLHSGKGHHTVQINFLLYEFQSIVVLFSFGCGFWPIDLWYHTNKWYALNRTQYLNGRNCLGDEDNFSFISIKEHLMVLWLILLFHVKFLDLAPTQVSKMCKSLAGPLLGIGTISAEVTSESKRWLLVTVKSVNIGPNNGAHLVVIKKHFDFYCGDKKSTKTHKCSERSKKRGTETKT